MPIPVRLPDGTVRSDLVLDISRGGLRVQCDREVAVIFHPGGERLVPENPQIIELEFGFPVGGKEERVSVSCRLCYIKGTVEGGIDIGMEYVEFKGDSFDHFQRFLEESLIPG